MEKICTGLYGGSFNPIHNGHIAIARQMREKAGLEEVWFMVSPQNTLKERGSLLDYTRRMAMARAALRGLTGLNAGGDEMSLPLPSYTWRTLQSLWRDFPEREYVLMIGAYNWARFGQCYLAADIVS